MGGVKSASAAKEKVREEGRETVEEASRRRKRKRWRGW